MLLHLLAHKFGMIFIVRFFFSSSADLATNLIKFTSHSELLLAKTNKPDYQSGRFGF